MPRRIVGVLSNGTFWTAIGSLAAVVGVAVAFWSPGSQSPNQTSNDDPRSTDLEFTPSKSVLLTYPYRDEITLSSGSATIVPLTGDIIQFVSFEQGRFGGWAEEGSATISINDDPPFAITFPDIFPLPNRRNCYAHYNSGRYEEGSAKIQLRIYCRDPADG